MKTEGGVDKEMGQEGKKKDVFLVGNTAYDVNFIPLAGAAAGRASEKT